MPPIRQISRLQTVLIDRSDNQKVRNARVALASATAVWIVSTSPKTCSIPRSLGSFVRNDSDMSAPAGRWPTRFGCGRYWWRSKREVRELQDRRSMESIWIKTNECPLKCCFWVRTTGIFHEQSPKVIPKDTLCATKILIAVLSGF